jgi:hypothetical protein
VDAGRDLDLPERAVRVRVEAGPEAIYRELILAHLGTAIPVME